MNISRSFRSALRFLGLAALGALVACGGSGAGSKPAAVTGTGSLNLAVTDAPSDAWQQVSVVLKTASLRNQADQSWTQVWAADPANPASGVVNLVDLASVAELLGKVPVAAGTYDRLQLTIDTTPASMTLVDDSGATIPAADITVIDPSGKGQINVVIDPSLQVAAGATASLQADFDLAHPLSIVQETVGGVQKVVLNLQVRHKALPTRIQDLQFARKLGKVTAATTTGFTLTDARGATFTYGVDANTLYMDADAKATGTLAGLTVNAYALVASNLNADGSLYARRVWYAADAATLPARTPEGLVRRVNAAAGTFTVFSKAIAASTMRERWGGQTVKVDANTVWTFHTTVPMGQGTGPLADIWRGVRVDVQLDAAGTTATAVNVNNAHDEGYITSVSATGLTFGWPGRTQMPMAMGVRFGPDDESGRNWPYYQNPADAAHAFSWWYFGLPSSASTVVKDLQDTAAAATGANLPVMGYANLYWDTVSGGWQAYQLVLAPNALPVATVTRAYTDGPAAGSGTVGVTFRTPFAAATTNPLTVTLDYAGDLQTVVEALTWNSSTRLLTFQAPVDHAQWAALLVPPAAPALGATRIWVRPVKNGAAFDWHAYNVEVFTSN
ncbi:DUF4382 domain-containing protein [Mesoterricola silvestris]|uniref:DUF4382 domain-containing protein n=1 Tax=Mesoterricola silvestris TaxID=2927979 RepID=A0AA48K9B0_9BACT|nr:DUF4382 domain-containing protein [Mesoterricola silvestris]BDU73819.1 hypothetical protein METEAL_29930 [Mesoterricola silvestris]